jgi:hypothetical protein
MFTIFVTGLILLLALLGLKAFELNRGEKVFLSNFRHRADRKFANYLRYGRSQIVYFVRRVGWSCAATWRSARRWMASKLHKVAQRLHN